MNVSHQLSVAICELDFVKIEELLRNGVNPNEIIPGEDFSAIHLGAGTTKSITELLLYHGADPNLQTSDGSTPLHVAVSWGKSDVVKTLLKYGADETIRDNENLEVSELAQYLEFWDCFDILQKRRKRRMTNQLKRKKKKYRLRQSVDMPAQVKVNVHHDCIEIFTEELERKSDSWNKDLFHTYERNRGSPLMSAFFRLPQNSDKESCSVISDKISSPPANVKTKKHLKAGSTDPYFDTDFRNGSVQIEDKANSADTESVNINCQNRFYVENKRQKYNRNTPSKSNDLEFSHINNSTEDVYGIRSRAYIDRCSSDKAEERNRSPNLAEPENVCKSIIAKGDTNSDESTVNFEPVSTVTPTMKTDVHSRGHPEESLDIGEINADINNHHYHYDDHHNELEEKNVDKYEHREDLGDQINCEEEDESRTDNYCLNKKPEDKHDDSCFRCCDQKLRIQIDLTFEPLKLENQNDNNSKIRNIDRSQCSTLLNDVNRDCFEKGTRNEQSMASKRDTDKPDNNYYENNDIKYKLTEDALGNPVVRVDARISHDLQSMGLDKHISEHKKNDCSESENTRERSNGDSGQRHTNSIFCASRSFQYPKEESKTHRKKKRTCKLIRNLKKRFRNFFA